MIPQPISVHSVPHVAGGRSFMREWGIPALLLALGVGVFIGLRTWWRHDWSLDEPVLIDAAVTGLAFFLICCGLISPFAIVDWLLSRVRTANTVYELWPDRLVMRITGRPPLTIARDNVGTIGQAGLFTPRLHIAALSHADTISIPRDVAGFDGLQHELHQWPQRGLPHPFSPAGVARDPEVLLRFLLVPFMVLSQFWRTHATIALMMVLTLAWSATMVRKSVRRRHRDKVSYALGIAAAAMPGLAMVAAFALWCLLRWQD